MSEYLFNFIAFVIVPFVVGQLLIRKPTLIIRLITTHIDVGDTNQNRSDVEENAYLARIDPQLWAKKYPRHVQLLNAMGIFFYAMSIIGLINTLGNLLSFLIW